MNLPLQQFLQAATDILKEMDAFEEYDLSYFKHFYNSSIGKHRAMDNTLRGHFKAKGSIYERVISKIFFIPRPAPIHDVQATTRPQV